MYYLAEVCGCGRRVEVGPKGIEDLFAVQGDAYETRTEHRPLRVRHMKVLTVREVADLLKVKPQWVYRMLRGGDLPFIRLGRQIRIDRIPWRSG